MVGSQQTDLIHFKMVFLGLVFCSLLSIAFSSPSLGFAQEPSIQSDSEGPETAASNEEVFLDQSRALLEQGHAQEALTLLERFLFQYPDSFLLADVYLQFAAVHAQMGELRMTIEALNAFLQNFPEESRVNDARLLLSDAYLTLGDLKGVMALWADIPGNEEIKVEVYDKVAQAYIEQQDYLHAVHVLIQMNPLIVDPEKTDLVRNDAIRIIQDKLQEAELHSLIKEYNQSFPADEAIIRLAEMYGAQSDHYREERELKRFISLFPNHAAANAVKKQRDEINYKIKTHRFLIGAAFHLSGNFAVFRENALNGAQLALEEFKELHPDSSVGLAVKDLDENPETAEATLEAWLDEFRPVAIIGPLLSRVVERITPIVEKAGLPLITPGATASRLSGLGNGIFRNAATPRFQCHAIAEYGVISLGLKRFAILFPKEDFGMKWAKCFSEEVERLGGEIVHAEPYPLNVTDFSPVIRSLKEADLKQGGVVETREEKRRQREISYTPGFQAIFLPGDAKKVGLMIPQLAFHNMNNTMLLGTSGWNSPEFVKLAGSYAEGATFIDAFFRESPEPAVQDFVGRYRTRFQQEPDLFAAQAYDAVRLILTAMEEGALTPRDIREVIAKVKNFPGASGLIYEVKEGEIIKKPFFVQVHKRKFIQIESSFNSNLLMPPPLPANELREEALQD